MNLACPLLKNGFGAFGRERTFQKRSPNCFAFVYKRGPRADQRITRGGPLRNIPLAVWERPTVVRNFAPLIGDWGDGVGIRHDIGEGAVKVPRNQVKAARSGLFVPVEIVVVAAIEAIPM